MKKASWIVVLLVGLLIGVTADRMLGGGGTPRPAPHAAPAPAPAAPPVEDPRASSTAIAAGSALAWPGSGWCFQPKRTLPGKASAMAWSVGSTRLQKGHWKSEATTIVTRASAGPRSGVSSTGTR